MKNANKNVSRGEEHAEGTVAKAIENQTAKLPSDIFLWIALGSIGVSAGLQIVGRKQLSNFIGQWAPTLLILGLYNKLVKVAGSDKTESVGTLGKDNELSDISNLPQTGAAA